VSFLCDCLAGACWRDKKNPRRFIAPAGVLTLFEKSPLRRASVEYYYPYTDERYVAKKSN